MAAPDCIDVTMGAETIERMKYVRDSNGDIAKMVVIVTGGDPIVCADTELPTSMLQMAGTVKLSDTLYADRIIVST